MFRASTERSGAMARHRVRTASGPAKIVCGRLHGLPVAQLRAGPRHRMWVLLAAVGRLLSAAISAAMSKSKPSVSEKTKTKIIVEKIRTLILVF